MSSWIGFLACYRRLEEAAPVEHVAAHHDLHDAIGAALGF